MTSVNCLPDRNGINFMGTLAQALAHPVMVGVTCAGTANVNLALGNDAAANNGKDKQGLHGWGLCPITLTRLCTLFTAASFA